MQNVFIYLFNSTDLHIYDSAYRTQKDSKETFFYHTFTIVDKTQWRYRLTIRVYFKYHHWILHIRLHVSKLKFQTNIFHEGKHKNAMVVDLIKGNKPQPHQNNVSQKTTLVVFLLKTINRSLFREESKIYLHQKPKIIQTFGC